MEYLILGPLEVRDEHGHAIRLGRGRQQAVLVSLLLRANATVPAHVLIDEVWGAGPPASASNALQVYVSQLRGILEPGRPRGQAAQTLVTGGDGYLLRAAPHELDLLRFERLVADGEQAMDSGELERASETLAAALSLWRGRPFAGVELDGLWAVGEALRLEDLRLAAAETRYAAELALRRHERVVSELEQLSAAHPLRERLRGQLIVALYRSGRQVDALAQYRSLRHALVDELGIEPSAELQRLEQAVLRQDPALELPLAVPTPSPDAGAPARKPVTVVVVDVDLAEQGEADPEALQAAARAPLQAAAAAIEAHGGMAESAGGTTVLGAFGVPVVREDDALRALRAAVELRERIGERDPPLSVRIGVASGEALVAGSAQPLGGRLTGAPMRDATRLAQAAGPGAILISERTRKLTRGTAQVEADPAAAGWQLVHVESDAPAIARTLDLPLVGRRTELATLEATLTEVLDTGRGTLVTVLGHPGIGKSRLVSELATAVGDQARTLFGRCRPYGEGTTFQPVAEIIGAIAGDDVGAGLRTLLRRHRNGALAAERIEAALGTGTGASPEQLFWAIRTVFEFLARRRPLVVVLDDVHWAENLMLDLIDYLAERIEDAPVLVVVVSRPELVELRPAWAEPSASVVVVDLQPLAAGDAATLADVLLGTAELDESLRSRIVAAAEGNPLFIEQMVALLGEDRADKAELTVPPSIEALMASRLDLLGDAERAVVTRAAVIGREFTREGLGVLAAGLGGLDESLATLGRKQFVGPVGSGRFSFRHELIRDAAYRALPKLLRADLHEQIADWLEQGPPGADTDEVIGHHLEEAFHSRSEVDPVSDGLSVLAHRASEHLGLAGERAFARADVPAAVQLLARATGLRPASDRRRVELLVALSGALREIDDYSWGIQVADEARELASGLGEEGLAVRAGLLRLHIRLLTESDLSATELLDASSRAVTTLDELGDDLGLAEAWGLVAWASWLRCRAADTEKALRKAVRHARRAGDQRAAALNVNLILGAAYLGPLPVGEAIARCEEALSEARGQIRLEAVAYRALGGLAAMLGDFAAARAYLQREWALIEERRLRRHGNLEVAGAVELLAGNAEKAAEHLRLGCELLGATGEIAALPTLQAMLAEALYRQDLLDEAEDLTELSAAAASADDVLCQVQWRGPRAKIAARQGEGGRAEQLAKEAVALARSTDFLNLQGQALLDLAEVYRVAGRPEKSGPVVERAARLFTRKGNAVAAQQAQALSASLGRAAAAARPA